MKLIKQLIEVFRKNKKDLFIKPLKPEKELKNVTHTAVSFYNNKEMK
jgi:uncharacterized UPF0146 family protein